MKRLLIFCIVLVFFQQANAQTQTLSLEDALKAGLENNYGVLISKNESKVAHNNNTLANAGFLPQLNADGSYTKRIENFNQTYATGIEQKRNNAGTSILAAGVEMDWVVFDGLRMFAAQKSLQKLAEMGELAYKQSMEQTTAQISNSYYDLVRQQLQLKAYEQSIQLSLARLDIAKTRYEVGSSSKLEYLQAQVDLNADSSAYLKQLIAYRSARLALSQLMGKTNLTDFKVMDTLTPIPTLALEDLLTKSKDLNPQLQIARRQEAVNLSGVDAVRSQYFPQLSLMGRYNFTNQQAQAGFILINQTQGFWYGGSAKWNIFNGGLTTKQLQNAQIEAQNAHLNLQNTELSVETALRQAYEQYAGSLSILNMEKINLKAAFDNLDIARDRYQIGKTDVLTYRQSQVSFIDARTRFLTALYNVKAAETQLLQQSGQMVK